MVDYYLKLTPGNVDFKTDQRRIDYYRKCFEYVWELCGEQSFGIFNFLYQGGDPFQFAMVSFKPKLKPEYPDSDCGSESKAKEMALNHLRQPKHGEYDIVFTPRFVSLEERIQGGIHLSYEGAI